MPHLTDEANHSRCRAIARRQRHGRWLLWIAFVCFLSTSSPPAAAQRGVQILDFFLQQADQELQRQQQREIERQRADERARLHSQFVAAWRECHSGSLGACDSALAYPFANPTDRQRLIDRRTQIVAEQRAVEARVERERIEAEREAARQREATDRQRLEQEREERRKAELDAFLAERNACRAYNLAACDTAWRSALATSTDRGEITASRAIAERFHADRASCRNGGRTACESALTSPALTEALRSELVAWHAAAPYSGPLEAVTMTAGAAYASLHALPTSTIVTSAIASVLALALGALAYRNRGASSPRPAVGRSPSDAASESPDPNPTVSASDPEPTAKASPPAPEPAVRDSAGAIAAMELAHAYLQEVNAADTPAWDDKAGRKEQLNTLSLATKQLELARKLDADAVLAFADGEYAGLRLTLNDIKAEALLLEGITHQTHDLRRAVPALTAATQLNPNSARAFYVLGLVHASNRDKKAAMASLECAVALDPKNLSYRKELNRVQNLTAAEIAAFKATRTGERVFDAGIKTANAGIMAWNIFAVTWNIVTFPLRLVLRIAGHR